MHVATGPGFEEASKITYLIRLLRISGAKQLVRIGRKNAGELLAITRS